LNFENVTFPDSVGFGCRKCGFCCREQPADLDEKEHQQIEAKGFKGFSVDRAADGLEGLFIRRKKDGSCFFLTKNNDCRIYDIRPAGCRIQPFTITDWDYEKNTIELALPAKCRCKGILVARAEIETLVNEEALLFAQYLRNEKQTWIPRIANLN